MDLNNENEQLARKINNFLNAHIKVILGCVIGLFVIGLAVFLTIHLKEKSRQNTIAGIERIVYELEDFKAENKADKAKAEEDKKSKADKTDESETSKKKEDETEKVDPKVLEKEDAAITELKKLVGDNTSGYAGFRANTVIAEIYFARKDYKNAIKFYELAAKADNSNYIAGIAYFNVAACADELGDNQKAAEFYEKASKVEDFPLTPRALFNLARIHESSGKKDEAISVYKKNLEKYPRNEWALLGKSRLLELEK